MRLLSSHSKCVCGVTASRRRGRNEVVRAKGDVKPGQLLRRSAEVLVHAGAIVGALSTPEKASALLTSPDANLPRSPEAALRRSIPVVNKGSAAVQDALEDVQYQLRIPQRKPWASMLRELEEARKALDDESASGGLYSTVRESDTQKASEYMTALRQEIDGLEEAINSQSAESASIGAANALDNLSNLEILQAPSLPFQLPKQYADKPYLTGRAVVEMTVEREGGSFEVNGKEASREGTIKAVLDGYSAPLTSGNFAVLSRDGFFDGARLNIGGQALYALPEKEVRPADAPKELPLEFKPLGQFEPVYRLPLDTQSGTGTELPALPMSVYGALAMPRNGEREDLSDVNNFFIYLYDRRSAGLAGISFEEGEFPVFGYVIEGQDLLRQLGSDDRLKSVRLVSGSDRLVVPNK